jgi:hypothetical protein
MICNIWGVTIILLVILIIGLIVFSQKKDKEYQIENFTLPDNYDPLGYSNLIKNNNDIITQYMNIIQNINPSVILKDYSQQNTYKQIEDVLTSNVNIINTSMDELYGSTINRYSTIEQLNKLEDTVKDLENMTMNLTKNYINDKTYNHIKSLSNGMEINLISTNKTHFQDYKTGSNIAAYMINVNDGCLSVGSNDYDVYKCDDTNPRQYFKMEHIMNENAYQQSIDTTLPFDNINKSTYNYPFVMMKSVSNENCLTNNHGSLTVQPCYSYAAQRWMPL